MSRSSRRLLKSLFRTKYLILFTGVLMRLSSDKSIFTPGGSPTEVGFRRSELIPASNNGTDATVQGKTTFHWSLRDDPVRPLNFSHEYHVSIVYSLTRILRLRPSAACLA
jgi:hypothetical protein